MNKYIFLPILTSLLYATQALALTSISFLPFECNIAGETYVLSGDLLSNSGVAINVTADNVIIDGAGNTITYAQTGPGNGIKVSGNLALEVKNITLTQGSYDPGAGENVHGVYRSGNFKSFVMHNSTININHSGKVSGAGTYAILFNNFNNSPTGIDIYSNTINLTGTSAGNAIGFGPDAATSMEGKVYNNVINVTNLKWSPAGYSGGIGIGARNGSSGALCEVYGNTLNIASSVEKFQAIGGWSRTNLIIRDNVINNSSTFTRSISLDGRTINSKVYRNTINLTSANAANENSVGVRIRYGSSNNEVYENVINTTGCTGAGNCFAIRLGSDEGLGIPTNNKIHNNTLASNDFVISLEDASASTQFYDNTITGNGGYAIYALRWTTGDVIDGPSFKNETVTSGRIWLGGQNDGATSVNNPVFCGGNIAEGNIEVGTGVVNLVYNSTCGVRPGPPDPVF